MFPIKFQVGFFHSYAWLIDFLDLFEAEPVVGKKMISLITCQTCSPSGAIFDFTIGLLPLTRWYVVLGIQWLEDLGSATFSFKNLSMMFVLSNGQQCRIVDDRASLVGCIHSSPLPCSSAVTSNCLIGIS